MIILYYICLILLTVFSFGFVDANFPTKIFPSMFQFVHGFRPYATILYIAVIVTTFFFYTWILQQLKNKAINEKKVWTIIGLTCCILFFSYPAFSNDIFNYIATAKVAFVYKENPYIVMPIEISNEPMLAFLHAANKVALYGPSWIGLTFVPHSIGQGNLILTMYAFKALMVVFYLGICKILWRLGGARSLVFFALNPLVITETLISAHNDMFMMFLALLGFYFAKNNKFVLGLGVLILSIFVKGATLVLIPIYIHVWITKKWNITWYWCALLLVMVFLITPIREELYPWYFIWPLTFISLLDKNHFLQYFAYGFTFGLPLRFAPFIFFGDWGKFVPYIKKIVSIVPPVVTTFMYASKKTR